MSFHPIFPSKIGHQAKCDFIYLVSQELFPVLIFFFCFSPQYSVCSSRFVVLLFSFFPRNFSWQSRMTDCLWLKVQHRFNTWQHTEPEVKCGLVGACVCVCVYVCDLRLHVITQPAVASSSMRWTLCFLTGNHTPLSDAAGDQWEILTLVHIVSHDLCVAENSVWTPNCWGASSYQSQSSSTLFTQSLLPF